VILGYLLVGLVVGLLGRLVIPGPNPMGLLVTTLVGIGGALLGGLVGSALGLEGLGFVLSVAGAALIVWILQRR